MAVAVGHACTPSELDERLDRLSAELSTRWQVSDVRCSNILTRSGDIDLEQLVRRALVPSSWATSLAVYA